MWGKADVDRLARPGIRLIFERASDVRLNDMIRILLK
jgi:hypothetical protein